MSPRRFAPPAGFLCGAAFAEFLPGRVGVLVWRDGYRLADRRLTISRAERFVRRRLWVEIPRPNPLPE